GAVGNSRRATNDRRAATEELDQIVQSTDEFRQAESENRLIKLATGDGMALIFYHSPEDPVECALEISRAIKEQHSNLRLRMGVHSGPVSGVVDVTGRANVEGAGILILIAVLVIGSFLFWQQQKPKSSAIASAIPEKSIAVMPFENLSEDKANAYFADGIQDEILTRLSKIADLKVISRTSTQQY